MVSCLFLLLQVIQLQGDQRKNVQDFLLKASLAWFAHCFGVGM